MTTSKQPSAALGWGGIALFFLAALGVVSAVSLSGERAAASRPAVTAEAGVRSDARRTVSSAALLGVGLIEAVVLAGGSLLVMRTVGDVRRQRADLRRTDPFDDTELRPVLHDLVATEPGAEGDAALVAAVVERTWATGAIVVTRSVSVDTLEPGAVRVDARSGDLGADGGPDGPTAELVEGIDTGVPRRWVDAGRAYLAARLGAGPDGPRFLVAVREGTQPFGLRDLDVACQLAEAVSTARDVDELTELPNRRRLHRDLAAGLEAEPTVGLALVDVDHFVDFNAEHGHSAGDTLLKQVVAVVAANVREGDIVYRYGGGRLGVLLAGADSAETAEVAERVRAAVEDHDFELADTQPGGRLTVSVGTATSVAGDGDDAPTVLDLTASADGAVLEAKDRGRNRVVAAD